MSTLLEKQAAAVSKTTRDGLNKLTDSLGNLTSNTGDSVKRGFDLGVKTSQNLGRTLGDAAEKTGAVTEALVNPWKPLVGGKKKKTRRAKKSLRLRLKKSRKPKTLRKKRRKH